MGRFEYNGASIDYEETGSGEPVLFIPGSTESVTQHARALACFGAIWMARPPL